MSIPGFTAEATVYRSRRTYRGPAGAMSVTSAALSPAERSCPALDCTHLPNGEYPNPESCTSFCYCTNGRSIWMDCPKFSVGDRLHFNPALKVCDWPDSAGCVLPSW